MSEEHECDVQKPYLGKHHEKGVDDASPYSLACPELHKGDSKTNTSEEQRLHKVLLDVHKVALESMDEGWALVCKFFAFLSAHDDKWSVGMLAWYIC